MSCFHLQFFFHGTNTWCASEHAGETIMKRFCQLQKLDALGGLECAHKSKQKPHQIKSYEIGKEVYDKLLDFAWTLQPHLRAYYDWPHPDGAIVLSNWFENVQKVACDGGRHVSNKQPNNFIQYQVGSTSHYGEVVDIIRLWGNFDAKILKVRRANDVPRQDGLAVWLRRINVRNVSLGLFDLITSDQVIGPVACRPMAPGALGHRGASILLCEFQSALPEAAPDMMDIDDD